MPKERLSMRKIKEILRLKHDRRHSHREIAKNVSIATSTVSDCLARARAAGIGWPLDPGMDDATLEAKLYPGQRSSNRNKALPDFSYIHRELRRNGVTLQLLWQEYKQNHPHDGYQHSQFCAHYKEFRKALDVTMRQHHRAGEKVFTDFSGNGIDIIDPISGQVEEAELFVAVLGASSYTYAEAFASQQIPCWIDGHIHTFEFFGGVTQITVCDNTKTAVTHPCHYEPDLNPTFLDMAKHYNTVIIPARKRKPKDKAKVENAVLISQRWILASLRNHRFFSIAEANQAIWDKLEDLNTRTFQKLDTTRRNLYESLDKPALQPLPLTRYAIVYWAEPRVNIDYHVEIKHHYYSVPYTLVHKKLEARYTHSTVEILFKGKRVASHARSFQKGGYTTLVEHMPEDHQRYVQWTPSRILAWAAKSGPATARLARKILDTKAHPQQGYRSCLGLMRLGKSFGNERLEAACTRALSIGTHSYKSVKSILSSGLDRQPLPNAKPDQPAVIEHENVRGSDYYH